MLEACSASRCDYGLTKSVAHGGDAVSGVGDDAFFLTTCEGTGLLGHDQLWAKGKGLVPTLRLDCHEASALAQDKSDQAMID